MDIESLQEIKKGIEPTILSMEARIQEQNKIICEAKNTIKSIYEEQHVVEKDLLLACIKFREESGESCFAADYPYGYGQCDNCPLDGSSLGRVNSIICPSIHKDYSD